MKTYIYLVVLILFSFSSFAQSPFTKNTQANGPQTEITCFPNPAKESVTFKYNSGKTLEISIYNVLGSRVKTFTHTGNETVINISDLQKGLYFIRFSEGNAMVSKSFTKSE